jgi:MFS family permease
MRKIMAVAAVPGLIAGVYIFAASFFGQTMDKLGARAFLLHAGIFALFIPLVLVERRSKGIDTFRGKPRWVLRSMQIFFLLFIVIFFSFLAMSHAAMPDIVNGEYVLNSHGNIVGHISERDYLFLKGWELRLFAWGWMLAYFSALMFWWFPQQDEWTVVMPD